MKNTIRIQFDEKIVRRFWKYVDKSNACWLWTGGRYSHGYGQFRAANQNPVLAHRFVWYLLNGDIPGQLLVCHTCDTRLCVNPSHLFLGTHTDNIVDCVSKGRHVSNAIKIRGEQNSSAKVTQAIVDEIRATYSSKGKTRQALSRKFGISPVQVWNIATGRSWANENQK